ncbi:MAG: putative DNA binding domain-containing protein [Pyrinomonadaceae bacterium]|nr:putative DNA binding domain-containing protein [Pyrinomonadaceae bacterium]
MTEAELQSILAALIVDWENEVVEFKNVSDSYSTSKIGEYFSALANEANLRDKERAWLIFGVDNQSRKVVGSDYRPIRERLAQLKNDIATGAEPRVTFREIHEVFIDGLRVIMFEIPAAPRGIPISWNGHYHARAGESLVSLGLDKLDEIRAQTANTDWTAQIINEATIAHIDPTALSKARQGFAIKHANTFNKGEVLGWSDEVFLERSRLTRDGKITRAAILLLGRPESAALLSPHPAEITWKLVGPETAYEHFRPPFLSNTTALYRRIRNVQVRILPADALIQVELSKYDQEIVLEALHNCIAHQDYERNGRVIVTEFLDKLTFRTEGNFFSGNPDDYLDGTITPSRYRNPFLTQAMAVLNMIDTMGYGIYKMYRGQAKRYFPLPDFDLSEGNAVTLTIYGHIVDPAYSRLLIQKTDLSLPDIIALDRVQKKLQIEDTTLKRLRKAGLVEGRKSNLFVSASVASATATEADYILSRGLENNFYNKLITDYLGKFGPSPRSKISLFLTDKLSDTLTVVQKEKKIQSLLTNLRRNGVIERLGAKKTALWKLIDN